MDFSHTYDCNYSYNEGEAEKETQSKLLLCLDLGSSKDDDGNAGDFNSILAISSRLKALGRNTENIGDYVQTSDEPCHGLHEAQIL